MAVEDDTSHVANIGKMVEDMELKMRNLLQEVYFGKAKDVVGDLRSENCCQLSGMRHVLISRRHPIAKPDEPRQGDTEGHDQQHGPVTGSLRLGIGSRPHTCIIEAHDFRGTPKEYASPRFVTLHLTCMN